jgi:Ca2+-dependent lipid-binding protein
MVSRYEFPLEEMDGHIVEINLYDKDHGSKNEFLGYAAIDVKNFMQQSSLLAGMGK